METSMYKSPQRPLRAYLALKWQQWTLLLRHIDALQTPLSASTFRDTNGGDNKQYFFQIMIPVEIE